MGMVTQSSTWATSSRGRPWASLPTMSATGRSSADGVVGHAALDAGGDPPMTGGRPGRRAPRPRRRRPPAARGTPRRPTPAPSSGRTGRRFRRWPRPRPAPAASAARTSVPTLPGSVTSTSTSDQVGGGQHRRGGRTALDDRHHALGAHGVGRAAQRRLVDLVQRGAAAPGRAGAARRCRPRRRRGRPRTRRSTGAPAASASASSVGPSTTNAPSSTRAERCPARRARRATRWLRAESGAQACTSGDQEAVRGVPRTPSSRARRTPSGSVTARSARILRSTSTPARCRPLMNLL